MRAKILLFTLLLGSCQVGQKYSPPEITVAPVWKNPQVVAEIPQVKNWWEVFHDPQLASLIEQAIKSSPSLLAASERVEQARDFAKATKAQLFPQLNFDPSGSNKPQSAHSFGSWSSNPPPTLIKNHISEFSLPLTLLYEFDFWGKWRSQYQSAKMSAEAQQEAYQTALLLLTTDLANAYFQLRIQDSQIALYREMLTTRKTALEIKRSLYDTQLANYEEVSVYQTDYSTVESAYYDALRKRALFENEIAVLIGTSPSEFKLDAMPLEELPPQLPATLPAQVLLRRPDLREQERKMAAVHAEINVAYASYFPTADLTGALNFLSNNFMKTIKNSWLIGGNLIQVLFDAGGRSDNVNLFTAKFHEAVATYREQVLSAFQEVEDSLVSLDWIAKEMRSIEVAMRASQIGYKIALDQYRFGLSNYLKAADNERISLDQKQAFLELLSQRYLFTLHLIKAIGGSW